AVLVAHILIEHDARITPRVVAEEWLEHLDPERPYGPSEKIAIVNLSKGKMPPVSGMDNEHRWSDGAAMRVAPIGIVCAGNPGKAAELAEIDAMVSHAYDGIYCAQAVAASIAVAMDGAGVDDVIQAGLDAIPESWSKRKIREALQIAERHRDVVEAAKDLHEGLKTYHIDVAPEAVSLAYAVFKLADGDFKGCVAGGANIGRDADTIAAMAGAMSGALNGIDAVPPGWVDKVEVIRGQVIPSMRGCRLRDPARGLTRLIRAGPSRFL
ncbi:TPA: crystallin J1, partial [Candidatus Bathyarchaeota archaeon]|nr:crystallin J1 [Candidatus Bathyarchaeota archaeon]